MEGQQMAKQPWFNIFLVPIFTSFIKQHVSVHFKMSIIMFQAKEVAGVYERIKIHVHMTLFLSLWPEIYTAVVTSNLWLNPSKHSSYGIKSKLLTLCIYGLHLHESFMFGLHKEENGLQFSA